jgi:hypothetical protein
LVQLIADTDYGWPECYYDQQQNKLVLAPEYGGDGGKTVGVCAQRQGRVRSLANEAALMRHKAREMLVSQRTQLLNALRGHLTEVGVIAPRQDTPANWPT